MAISEFLGTELTFYWKGGTSDTANLNTKHPEAVKGDMYFISTDNNWNDKTNWLVANNYGWGGSGGCNDNDTILFYDAHRYPVAGDEVVLSGKLTANLAGVTIGNGTPWAEDITCSYFPQSELLYGGASGAWQGITHSYGTNTDAVGPNGETGATLDAINGGKLSRFDVYSNYTSVLQEGTTASNWGGRLGERISQGNGNSQFNMGYAIQGLSILSNSFNTEGQYGTYANLYSNIALSAPLDITKTDITSNMNVIVDGERYNGENQSSGGYPCGQTFGQIFIDREGTEHRAYASFRDVYITDLYQDISYWGYNNLLTTKHVVPTVNFAPAYRGAFDGCDWATMIECQVENLNVYPNVNDSTDGTTFEQVHSLRVGAAQSDQTMGMSLGTVTQHYTNPWHDINDDFPSDNLLRNTVTYYYAGGHQDEAGGTINNLILQSGWAKPLVTGGSDIPWTILNGQMGAWLPSKLSSYDRDRPYWAGFRIAGKSGDVLLDGDGMLINGTNAIFDFLIGTYVSSNVASESVREDTWRNSYNTGK